VSTCDPRDPRARRERDLQADQGGRAPGESLDSRSWSGSDPRSYNDSIRPRTMSRRANERDGKIIVTSQSIPVVGIPSQPIDVERLLARDRVLFWANQRARQGAGRWPSQSAMFRQKSASSFSDVSSGDRASRLTPKPIAMPETAAGISQRPVGWPRRCDRYHL
jgi:hypothetical protein